MATVEHVAGVATSSSVHLHGMAEQALMAAASQVAAASAAQLRDAIASCQPNPHGAATPRLLPTPATAPPASLPIEDVPYPPAASKAASPPLPPPPCRYHPAPVFFNSPLFCCPASCRYLAPFLLHLATVPPFPGPLPPSPKGPPAVGNTTLPSVALDHPGCSQ